MKQNKGEKSQSQVERGARVQEGSSRSCLTLTRLDHDLKRRLHELSAYTIVSIQVR